MNTNIQVRNDPQSFSNDLTEDFWGVAFFRNPHINIGTLSLPVMWTQ